MRLQFQHTHRFQLRSLVGLLTGFSLATVTVAQPPAPGAARSRMSVAAELDVNQIAPAILKKLDATELKIASGRASVVVFSRCDCPIANAYQPYLQQLKTDFSSHPIDFVLVYADPQVTSEAAQEHVAQYHVSWSPILDNAFDLAKKMGAKTTPEAFLVDPNGNILYRGRIDDRFPDFGKKRARPTKEELRDALSDYVSGAKIRTTRTSAIGCVMRYEQP